MLASRIRFTYIIKKKKKNMEINSLQNTQIKNIIKLKKASERKKQGLFVVEGEREINIALKSGLALTQLFVSLEYNKNKEQFDRNDAIKISKDVFDKVSIRQSPDGNLGLFKTRDISLSNANIKDFSLIIILEGIEKPGNLGAIMRTADAAGVDAVIINEAKIDIYNSNAIRASQGTIFSTPLYISGINETKEVCQKNNINIIASTPAAKNNYLLANFKEKVAILMGSEDSGLSDKWLKLADKKIKIEMKGTIDSLNLSVSTAVLVFEALRQKGKSS